MTRRAFTLIELLIVVAIIAILAAIAVPNFLEAQTRSKISRVKADQRAVATALEAYGVDFNTYPRHWWPRGTTNLALGSNFTLQVLTTPVAYLTSTDATRDPFVDRSGSRVGVGLPGAGIAYDNRHQQYQNYETFPQDYGLEIGFRAWCLWSLGPNGEDDAVQFRLYNYATNPGNPMWAAQFTLGVYDPTNGTISGGDIPRFGGAVPSLAGQLTN